MAKSRSAREQLRDRLDEQDWSASKLSEVLGTSPSMVSRWLAGLRSPSIAWASRIEDTLGIPIEAWAKPTKKPKARTKVRTARAAA